MKNLFSHLKNLSIYGFGQFFNLVTPLLVVPHIIAVCGEENFGKTAIAMAVSFFLIVFVDYGSDLIGTKEISLHREQPKKLNDIFITTIGVKFTMLLLVILVSVPVFLLVPFFKKEYVLFLFSLTVIVGQFLNPTWFLQGTENVKWITGINLISKSIYLIAVFCFISTKQDYIFANLFWGIGMIIAHSFFLILIFKKHFFTLKSIILSEVIKQLKQDFSFFWSQIFTSLQMYAPVFVLGLFGSNLLAGQYKIIDQVVTMFKTYLILFFNFVFPKTCYDIEHLKVNKLKNWKLFNGLNLIFISTVLLITCFFAKPIIMYFTYTDSLSKTLQVSLLIPFLMAVSFPLKQLVLGYNQKSFYIKTTVFIGVFVVVSIYLFLEELGILSAIYSLVLAEVLVILFYLYCVRKTNVEASNIKR